MEETSLKLKLHIKPHKLIEDFNTPFSSMNSSTRQKFNRAIRELTDVMTQMDLRDNYRTFHPNTHTHKIPSSQDLMESSLKINHILGNKANLNR